MIQEPCAEAAIRSVAPASPCRKSAEHWVLAATILGSSLAFIDGTVVNVALPALQADLNATVAGVQWVIEAYSLLLSALLLVGGSLGDRYGRRRVFVIGVLVFAAASAWCGFASGIRSLIAARAAQGFGAALLVPGSLAIISNAFREEDRGRAIATWSGFSAITAAIGPVLGGWLIERFSWRAVFFINLPLALVVVAISYWRVPESSSAEKGRLDWAGAIVIALGLAALVWALIESSALGFSHPAIIGALIAGLVLIIAFVFLETRVRAPMVPLDLFRSRTFTGANLLTFLLYSALGGTFFFLPLNLIQVQHYSPTAAGAALLPFILIIFLLSRWSGENDLTITTCVWQFPLIAFGMATLLVSVISPRLALSRVRIPGAAFLASVAYSVYLSHKLVIHLVTQLCSGVNLPLTSLPALLLVEVFIYAIGAILFFLVERPFLQLRRRITK